MFRDFLGECVCLPVSTAAILSVFHFFCIVFPRVWDALFLWKMLPKIWLSLCLCIADIFINSSSKIWMCPTLHCVSHLLALWSSKNLGLHYNRCHSSLLCAFCLHVFTFSCNKSFSVLPIWSAPLFFYLLAYFKTFCLAILVWFILITFLNHSKFAPLISATRYWVLYNSIAPLLILISVPLAQLLFCTCSPKFWSPTNLTWAYPGGAHNPQNTVLEVVFTFCIAEVRDLGSGMQTWYFMPDEP
jgi:hypothetical protein